MLQYFLVAIGGAIGSVARYWMNGLVTERFRVGEVFPLGTLIVNVSGCFVIGFIATLTDAGGRFPALPATRTFFMVGLCGGYTTFSAFGLQTLDLARDDQWLGMGMNVVLSVIACLFAVWLGHVAAMLLRRS